MFMDTAPEMPVEVKPACSSFLCSSISLYTLRSRGISRSVCTGQRTPWGSGRFCSHWSATSIFRIPANQGRYGQPSASGQTAFYNSRPGREMCPTG